MSITKNVFTLNQNYDLRLAGNIAYTPSDFDTGNLWGWGFNSCGGLGLNNTDHYSSPVQIPGTQWRSLRGGGSSIFGIKTDNTLWTWGRQAFGNLGLNTLCIHYSSPVQIPGNWRRLGEQVGVWQTYAFKDDNTVWAWGNNCSGVLGLSDVIHRSSPVQFPGTSWCYFTAACQRTFALKTDNSLWGWGCNEFGQIGTNNVIHRSSPVQIPGSWSCIVNSSTFALALKADNTLWSWGVNTHGSLGINETVSPVACRSSPTQIPGNWIKIGAGATSGFGIKNDNTLWAWGENIDGMLGDGTTIYRSSPVQIPGTNWSCIGMTDYATRAFKNDNTLWAWGLNLGGSVGNNTIISYSSPVQIPGTEWDGRVNQTSLPTFAFKCSC